MSTEVTTQSPSRLNAFKHGMRSSDTIFLAKLTDEERAQFDRLHEDLYDEYQPLHPHECLLVDRIVLLHFRSLKISEFELRALHLSERYPLSTSSILNHLDRIARYEGRLDRCIRAAHNRLCTLQRSRNDFRIKLFDSNE